jgi:ATP-dependent helicase HrpB
MSFPVLEIADQLRRKLEEHRIVIVQAPPGAGKSTVLPLELINEPWHQGRKIIMLEPRRLAARSVAMRMASVLGSDIGSMVGYRVRFDTRTGPSTRIEVVTEGILTRMLQHDNALSDTGLVIFDEFHERSLHADLALALCLQIQQVLRPDLRILLMSATLDTAALSSVLQNAPTIVSQGKQFPVEIKYYPPDARASLTQHTVKAVRKVFHEHTGDVLVFLPGAGEINRAAEAIKSEQPHAEVFPLYGDLPYKKQQEAILPDPRGRRKIILATSIAETSLTIEGVSVVIDGGYTRVPRFNPRSGFTRLETVRVTKDSADQRAGRAGRLGPGICYRLWSEAVQSNLVFKRTPEILEADLAPLLLELFGWGIKEVTELTWITPPPQGAVSQAIDVLTELKAVDNGRITRVGKEMLRLPIHPRLAHMMIEASSFDDDGSLGAATDLAALLEERDPLPRDASVDISERVDILRRWRSGQRVNAEAIALERIEKLASSWRKLMKIPSDDTPVPEHIIGRLLMAAYPERIAKLVDRQNARYKLANGRTARLPENDRLVAETWLAVADLDAGVGDGKIFLAAPLSPDDILPVTRDREVVSWDEERGMITGAAEKFVGNLVVATKRMEAIPQMQRVAELCSVVRRKGLKLLGWSEAHVQWQARVLSLRKWRAQDLWPDVSDAYLMETLNEWLGPFLADVYREADFRKLDLNMILSSLLPWDLQAKVDLLAPARIAVPSGSMIRINYFADGAPPVMEVRLQEVFGLPETPAVNEGRTKIILHLLSPGYKPVQVTQDLRSFWNNTYQEVRKELRSRYPKHSWPDDPWTAEAVRGAKRRK